MFLFTTLFNPSSLTGKAIHNPPQLTSSPTIFAVA